MSVLVKGMEMPKGELGSVPVVIFADGAVCHFFTHEKLGNAIPVPAHGDLIDRDAINWEDEIWKKKCIPPYVVYNTWVIAKELPVVIESEGE